MRNDRKLEQIVFPVPSVCQYLTEESKQHVLQKTKCNEQGSKVDDFFKQTQWLFEEMQCKKELRGEGGGGRKGGWVGGGGERGREGGRGKGEGEEKEREGKEGGWKLFSSSEKRWERGRRKMIGMQERGRHSTTLMLLVGVTNVLDLDFICQA